MSETTIENEEQGLLVYEQKALQRVDPLRKQLNELIDKWKDVPEKIKDNAEYAKVKLAVKEFRDLKGNTEKERKDVVALINKLTKQLNESYGKVWDDCEAEQKKRSELIAFFDDEKARIKAEADAKKEQKKAERQNAIIALGGVWSEGRYTLGSVSYGIDTIASAEDIVFDTVILKAFKEAYAAVEEERKQAAELEQQRQEELRQREEKLRLQQEEFDRREAELKKQEEQLSARQAESKLALISKRFLEIYGINWNGEVKMHLTSKKGFVTNELADFSEEEFQEIKDDHLKYLEKRAEGIKAAAEAKREEDRIEATYKARKSAFVAIDYLVDIQGLGAMSDEDYLSLYNSKKAEYDQKKKEEWEENNRIIKIQEEQKEKERLAELSENKRWREWIETKLKPLVRDMPAFESKRYMRATKIASEKFEEIMGLKPGNF